MERSLSACRPVETRRYRAARTEAVMVISPSVARREQLVEQVPEPGFEHLDLGLGHRPTRATCARMCIVVHIEWLVACAVVGSGSASACHAQTVARDFGQKNG